MLPVHQGKFASLQQNSLRWSNRLKQACAVCNSLSMVGRGSVAGLDVERALFKAVEARFLVSARHPVIVFKGLQFEHSMLEYLQLLRSFIHSFVHRFIHVLTYSHRSFIHSFICAYMHARGAGDIIQIL